MTYSASRTAVILAALIAAGCSTSHPASPPASRAASSTAPHATAAPPTRSTTTRPPEPAPLPAPTRITPLASPALAGEGAWHPAGDKLANGYALYTTELRPAAGFPMAGIAWIDTAATRLSLYAGAGQPEGTWPQEAPVDAAAQPALMAAFNSGFKIYNYRTGWYDQGRTAMPLQSGAASLVIFASGRATVADWGRDVSMGPSVVAVRQNLTLLVDHRAPSPGTADPAAWGAVLGGGIETWRAGIGVTGSGNLVYAGGPGLDPAALARLLVAAGAVRAMELDINPEWVSFAAFTHAGGIGHGAITGSANLLPGMHLSASHYLEPFDRDYFAVFAR